MCPIFLSAQMIPCYLWLLMQLIRDPQKTGGGVDAHLTSLRLKWIFGLLEEHIVVDVLGLVLVLYKACYLRLATAAIATAGSIAEAFSISFTTLSKTAATI